jgi:hypothetical protein
MLTVIMTVYIHYIPEIANTCVPLGVQEVLAALGQKSATPTKYREATHFTQRHDHYTPLTDRSRAAGPTLAAIRVSAWEVACLLCSLRTGLAAFLQVTNDSIRDPAVHATLHFSV